MPRITDITETRRGRYALFLDGEFAFPLDAETFADAHLHIDDALETWQAEAMELLALRDHAAGELYQKLCRKFDPHSAAAAVAKAGELGLLNDENFARRRAAELLRKRKSRREILQDLAAKGIDRDTAAAAVEALAPEVGLDGEEAEDPDLVSARALLERQYARKLAEGKTQQVAAALARRGFSHTVIRAAIEEAKDGSVNEK
mgnify:CR=1 FL=1